MAFTRLPPGDPEEPERRLEALLRLAPFGLLVVSAIPYLVTQHPSAGGAARTLAVMVIAAAWVAWWVAWHPGWAASRTLMRVYFTGFVGLCAVPVGMSPWFGFFCWIGYMHAYRYLTGPLRYVGLAFIAALSALAQLGGYHPVTPANLAVFLLVACLNGMVVTTFIYLGQKADDQNDARKRMIGELAEANRRLEDMMAENTGLHAQLLTQAREAGVLDERQRMAREIHDTLAQGLTGIITQLEAARYAERDDWERRIGNAKRLARTSLSEARRSVRAVRPEALEGTKLPEALAEVAEHWSAVNGVSSDVTTTGSPQGLHPEVEVTLLRVAQEALANVAKHAGASRVGITLSYMDDVVTLDVRDDGAGFRPESTPGATGADPGRGHRGKHGGLPTGPGHEGSGGFGLTAMRQRVTRLAGTLAIESEPGGGTAVSASIPAFPRATVAKTGAETVA